MRKPLIFAGAVAVAAVAALTVGISQAEASPTAGQSCTPKNAVYQGGGKTLLCAPSVSSRKTDTVYRWRDITATPDEVYTSRFVKLGPGQQMVVVMGSGSLADWWWEMWSGYGQATCGGVQGNGTVYRAWEKVPDQAPTCVVKNQSTRFAATVRLHAVLRVAPEAVLPPVYGPGVPAGIPSPDPSPPPFPTPTPVPSPAAG